MVEVRRGKGKEGTMVEDVKLDVEEHAGGEVITLV
jgi:hypothetical protein